MACFARLHTGMRIGKGEKLVDITKSMKAVAEGVLTSKAAHELACRTGIECPTIEGTYRVGSKFDWPFCGNHAATVW